MIMGPATMYIGLFSGTDAAIIPAASAINDAPAASGNWEDVGGTTDGVNLTVAQTYTPLMCDQIVDTPESRLTAREITVSTNMAEATLQNLQHALNDGDITEGTQDTYDLAVNDSATQPTYRVLLIDGFAPSGKRRRMIVRKVLNIGSTSVAYTKDGQTVFAVNFKAHYVSATVTPLTVIDDKAA
jgi:hypothetical protein